MSFTAQERLAAEADVQAVVNACDGVQHSKFVIAERAGLTVDRAAVALGIAHDRGLVQTRLSFGTTRYWRSR